MASVDLADKYLEMVGSRKLYPPLNSYSAFIQGSEYNINKYYGKWYGDQVKVDLFVYMKKGFSQVWLTDDDIRSASRIGMKEYLNDPGLFTHRERFLESSKKDIDAIYNEWTYEKISQTKWEDLFILVQKVRDIIWEVNAAVLFSVVFDRQLCEEVLKEEKNPITTDGLDGLWDRATEPVFESFDKVQTEYILTLIKDGMSFKNIVERCQYFLTDYYSAKTLSEIERAIRERYGMYLDNPERTEKALEVEKAEQSEMSESHKGWLKGLPQNESIIVDYLQTVMRIRDARKNFFAKGLTIIYRIAERMFAEVGVERDLIPFYTVRELLNGVGYLRGHVDELKDRVNGFQWLVPYDVPPVGLNTKIEYGAEKVNKYFKDATLEV